MMDSAFSRGITLDGEVSSLGDIGPFYWYCRTVYSLVCTDP